MRADYIPEDRLQRIRKCMLGVDRLITDVCLETGGRIDDVLALRKWQLDGTELLLMESKTNKRRKVTLTQELADKLQLVTQDRHQLQLIFYSRRPGKRRRKIHRTTYWRHFELAVRQCGYKDCNYSPHSLRKVYAVRLLRQTRSLEQVRRALGHEHITTTMLYALSDRQDELGLY